MNDDWEIEKSATLIFEDLPVGALKAPLPRADGRAAYMPFRGSGHYQLGVALREGRTPRCFYEEDGPRVTFDVLDIPEYGVLLVGNFSVD
ncbi:hypothetical protein [Sphingomonas sp.]|uniref:hypothetical protein n=1 Tax=Sphingomonas sp. TaxID=28214 RepID=UPI001B09652C|nr:hypothetical protein [Sphingomonas sp.]MBO9715152.1 hypothetical protein [Sphingomonas sp.]